jgi:hypothetical protein
MEAGELTMKYWRRYSGCGLVIDQWNKQFCLQLQNIFFFGFLNGVCRFCLGRDLVNSVLGGCG